MSAASFCMNRSRDCTCSSLSCRRQVGVAARVICESSALRAVATVGEPPSCAASAEYFAIESSISEPSRSPKSGNAVAWRREGRSVGSEGAGGGPAETAAGAGGKRQRESLLPLMEP